MVKSKGTIQAISFWLAKSWVQWSIATLFFFFLSWLYMGHAINNCSTTTTALGSDSTGGFGWMQWAAGNDLSWGHENVSNYPLGGESLSKPQHITSALLIFIYKIFSSLTTPICGLNLVVLAGFMSTGLLMFGLIKWLLKRFDIALFAGYAAAFVTYHQFKMLSHVNYANATIFIAIIWSYLWFISKPSYKRAALLSLISATGYYYDGYFILITSVLLGCLLSTSFIIDFFKILFKKAESRKNILRASFTRLRYILFITILLGILLLPILISYKAHGAEIKQSLAIARSDPRGETFNYGLRPIELLLPGVTNPIMPDGYGSWRQKKLHNSNYSESTLYVGYVVIILAVVSLIAIFYKAKRKERFQNIPYSYIVATVIITVLGCFIFSLPAAVTVYGHTFDTPVAYLVKLTASWRVLARFFLVIDPLIVILAAFGLYVVSKNWRKLWQIMITILCVGVLFLEYLPSTFNPTGDLYKDAPKTYQQLAKDPQVKIVAEYPFADFTNSPTIFTYQPVHKKLLLNASDSSISRGPLDASLAGLNDRQTLGVLRKLRVDVILGHGIDNAEIKGLIIYKNEPVYDAKGKIDKAATIYSYKIASWVPERDTILIIEKGYDYLSVDANQISHRAIMDGTLRVDSLSRVINYKNYDISFSANALCGTDSSAHLVLGQHGKTIWSGTVNNSTPIQVNVDNSPIDFHSSCVIDVTNMSVDSSYK